MCLGYRAPIPALPAASHCITFDVVPQDLEEHAEKIGFCTARSVLAKVLCDVPSRKRVAPLPDLQYPHD